MCCDRKGLLNGPAETASTRAEIFISWLALCSPIHSCSPQKMSLLSSRVASACSSWQSLLLNSVNYFLALGLQTVSLDDLLWQFPYFLFNLFLFQSTVDFHVNWMDFSNGHEGGWLVVTFPCLRLLLESLLLQWKTTGVIEAFVWFVRESGAVFITWAYKCLMSLGFKASLLSENLRVSMDFKKLNFPLNKEDHNFSIDFQAIRKTILLVQDTGIMWSIS